MKVKLNEIVSYATPVTNEDGTVKEEAVFVQLQSIKFPVKVSYRIKRLMDRLQPIFKTYDAKRNELVLEFADAPDKEGNQKVTDPEKLKLFYEKLKELLESEEEIEWEKLKVEDLGDVPVAPKLLVPLIFE